MDERYLVLKRIFGLGVVVLLVANLVAMGSAQDPEPVMDISRPLPSATPRDASFARGVALGLYYKDDDQVSYVRPLSEIAELGADTVSLVVTWSQETIHTNEVRPDSEESRDDEIVRQAIRDAHDADLRVLLFPILKIERRATGEWRGTLAPTDTDAWFESYFAYLTHYADIAEELGVEYFSIGSELGNMERYDGHWREMIRRLRLRFSGRLLYSANWDHYSSTPFWDALDWIGLTGYYELTEAAEDELVVETLVQAWTPIRDRILGFANDVGLPFVFTEIGYFSQHTTAWHPWDYTLDGAVDLRDQYLCYQAFYEVWRDVPEMGGVFFWHWFGEGGTGDNSYTPRGKPAAEVIRHWYTQWPGPERSDP